MRVARIEDLPAQHRAQAAALLRGEKPRLRALPTPVPAKPAKRTKFGNVRVFLEGEWFDSQLEYDCWCQLKLRRAAGEIAYIKRQVRFLLEGSVEYRADFECVLTPQYATRVGVCSEVWDAKGKDTQASINKRKQVLARYGVAVRLWTKADR